MDQPLLLLFMDQPLIRSDIFYQEIRRLIKNQYQIIQDFLRMFKITPQQLSQLFDQDHIKDGSSIARIKKWGKVQGLTASLNTSSKFGRQQNEDQIKQRILKYGDNQPIIKKGKTLFQMILDNFEDLMLRILCFSAVISLVLGIATEGLKKGWLEGASILAAVIIIITVTAGNNYIKEKQFQKLNAVAEKKNVNVIRSRASSYISVYDILVGDIQQIQTGEIISVDGLLIQNNAIVADESAMTGEPKQIKKGVLSDEHFQIEQPKIDPFIVSGSRILQGTGKMLVLATGKHSQYGRLKLVLQSETDETPLQQKLSILAEQIGLVGTYSAGLTFLCLFGHIVFNAYSTGNFSDQFFRLDTVSLVVKAFIIAISIIVVSVPEGLPLAVTISLAFSVGKMKQENNLVRYLAACETMGGVDNICSDKTGTLTKNTMSVLRIFQGTSIIDKIDPKCLDREVEQLLSLSVAQNSSANPKITRNASGIVSSVQIGNKTECALLQMIFKMGFDYLKIRNEDRQVAVYPFSSANKSMTTLVKQNNKMYAFTKGAPDFVLEHCKFYLDEKGNKQPIDQKYKQILHQKLKEFAEATLRTLLLAFREAEDCNKQTSIEVVAKDLTVLCMVGIKDPIREQIPESVRKCHAAGVTVRMITGDNQNTAIAIAKQAGILDVSYQYKENDCVVMLGKDFREFVGGLVNAGGQDQHVGNMENFKKVSQNLKVLARSSPTDKYLMATGLKALNHVVAMTGDGTNDAPALKKADIGFAMGITGTEVAKQAAGIILLDDNFASIVTAMKWGRNIFDSIRKFLQFQLTVNFVALVMAFTGAAVLQESPLNPIQMLWVNLIMDTLAALALATEPPNEQLLKRQPYSRFQGLITADMWRNIISQGLLQIAILGTILFKGPELFGIPSSFGVEEWTHENGKHLSIFFHAFVLLQIFNEINARKLKSSQINVFKNYFNNPLFHVIMVLTIIIQVICVEFGGQSLKATPLTINEHLICLAIGVVSIFAGMLFKLLVPSSLFLFLVPKQPKKLD